MTITLVCMLVGVAGNMFSVDIDENRCTYDLHKVIKAKKPAATIKCDADELQLYLAKRGDTWLSVESEEVDALMKGDASRVQDLLHMDMICTMWGICEVFTGLNDVDEVIHVLVKLPNYKMRFFKSPDADEWFVLEKRQRVHDEQRIEYFEMKEFPPMVREERNYKKVMIRESYRVIFDGVMKQTFDDRTKIIGGETTIVCANCKTNNTIGCADCIHCANCVVTGNAGTGKSSLYTYFIWRIIQSNLGNVHLVLNCLDEYYVYYFTTREFRRLSNDRVDYIQEQDNVIRLIDGMTDDLYDWGGVSIIFVAPGLEDLRGFKKSRDIQWILPPWSLKELKLCNTLLDDELRLEENVLVEHFKQYGGIPRYIFAKYSVVNKQHAAYMKRAMAYYDALKIVDIAERYENVNEKSGRILQMVPDKNNYRLFYHLEFASEYVVEEIIKNVNEDVLSKLSEFARIHQDDPSGYGNVMRGYIYEIMCHRWITLQQSTSLVMYSLSSGEEFLLKFPEKFKVVRFDDLEKLTEFLPDTYYRPLSENFAALNAFITIDGICYCFQYTLNSKHDIDGSAMERFIATMESKGVKTFKIVFITTKDEIKDFPYQAIVNVDEKEHQKPSKVDGIPQYVLEDSFWNKSSKKLTRMFCEVKNGMEQ